MADSTWIGLGAQLFPDYSQALNPGQTITHSYTLTNSGATADTYILTLSSSRGWANLVNSGPVALSAGVSVTVEVQVTVPITAAAGLIEHSVITATSVTVPQVYDIALDTTTVSPISGTRHVAPGGPVDHQPAEAEGEEDPEGRWRRYTYDELMARDKVNLDIFWLRDESLEDTANLPDPDVLAQEIVEDLEAALEQFSLIAEQLEA